MPDQNFPKVHGCGRSFTAEEWAALPDRHLVTFPWGEVQEWRNCPCGSTLAIMLEPGESDPDLAPKTELT